MCGAGCGGGGRRAGLIQHGGYGLDESRHVLSRSPASKKGSQQKALATLLQGLWVWVYRSKISLGPSGEGGEGRRGAGIRTPSQSDGNSCAFIMTSVATPTPR